MWTRGAVGLFVVCVTLASCHAELYDAGLVYETDDAVVVEAASSRTTREVKHFEEDAGRQLTREKRLVVEPLTVEDERVDRLIRQKRQFGGWPGVLPIGPCFTSKGVFGHCTSFRKCYPYFKLPDLSNWETWILGMYDTCSYFTSSGRQMFGVCCSNAGNPAQPVPAPSPVEPLPPIVVPVDPIPEHTTAASPPPGIKPVKQNIPPNWPPPLPTHPPDHTIPPLPTHPPSPGWPGLDIVTPPTPAQPPPERPKPPVAPIAPPVKPPPPTWPGAPPPGVVQPPGWPPAFITHPPPRPPPTTARPPPAWPPQAPATTPANKPPPVPEAVGGGGHGSCGAKNGFQEQGRIVGGQKADQNEWPWIAALFNGARQFCGGSLIDSTHILTAAHCIAHMSSWDVARLSVKLGDHDLRTNTETQHIEKKVARVVRHRGFDSRTLYNDVAILTLDSPVTFTMQVKPVCLPSGKSLYEGITGTVIGWGSLREGGAPPAELRKVNIPVWTNAECKAKYGNAAPGGIVEHFLCAGTANKDSCSGDSGGPLSINSNGRWTQVGIVSWGIGCGKGQYPGVYTRVTYFMPWITKNLK